MDKTETYIRMCQMAEKAHPETFYRASFDVHDYSFRVEGNDLLWPLFRQDQLQEMVTYHQCPTCHISRISDYLEGMLNVWEEESMKHASDMPYEWTGPGTVEQLWLAFVMEEKHGKTWNGEEWTDDRT